MYLFQYDSDIQEDTQVTNKTRFSGIEGGPWKRSEITRLMEAIRRYGTSNLQDIANYVQTRNIKQVHGHIKRLDLFDVPELPKKKYYISVSERKALGLKSFPSKPPLQHPQYREQISGGMERGMNENNNEYYEQNRMMRDIYGNHSKEMEYIQHPISSPNISRKRRQIDSLPPQPIYSPNNNFDY
ncbi:hypothetical protein SNEBB_005330 [Seison nebaliae]|nr:hypothetical protein SNEBB_005330 [Seison nebaliae]